MTVEEAVVAQKDRAAVVGVSSSGTRHVEAVYVIVDMLILKDGNAFAELCSLSSLLYCPAYPVRMLQRARSEEIPDVPVPSSCESCANGCCLHWIGREQEGEPG